MSELIDREALLGECLNHYEVGNIEQNCTMDWICKTVRNFPAAPRWHRVEEPPKKTAKYLVWVDVNNGLFAAYPELRTAAYNVVYERWYVDGDQRTEWIGTPRYWMPIEPPKEDE